MCIEGTGREKTGVSADDTIGRDRASATDGSGYANSGTDSDANAYANSDVVPDGNSVTNGNSNAIADSNTDAGFGSGRERFVSDL